MNQLFDGDNLVESIVRNQFVNIHTILQPVLEDLRRTYPRYEENELYNYLFGISEAHLNVDLTEDKECTVEQVQRGHLLVYRVLEWMEMFWMEKKSDYDEFNRELAFAIEHIIRDCLIQLMDAVESAIDVAELNDGFDLRYSKLLAYVYHMTLLLEELSDFMGLQATEHDKERMRLMLEAMAWVY